MNMPTPCAMCEEVVEFNHMTNIGNEQKCATSNEVRKIKSIELFSGIGGIALAAEWAGIETVAFCEQDLFCQKVLLKHWPDVPVFDDIRTLNKQVLKDRGVDVDSIELISGGFPCQPYSVAGKRKGRKDERDLWPEMFRIIQELKPTWVVGENVANFVNMELERTLVDLESEGYETQSFIIPASSVNANHERKRTFIVAYSDSKRCQKPNLANESNTKRFGSREDIKKYLCYPNCKSELQANSEISTVRGKRLTRKSTPWEHRGTPSSTHWETNQPSVCRMDDGISTRLDKNRLIALGNAVVPQQIYPIFKAIMHVS